VASNPSVGDRAPEFELPSTEGTIALADRLAERSVLLVFYPGDDTPVCTKQLCDYRDHLDVFSNLDVDVLGINPQSLKSHRRFAKKHALPFPLLSDADKSVCRAYGAIGLLGMTKRALVLIGRDGRIRWQRTDLPIFHQSASDLEAQLGELASEPAS
jgi:peroxiredoxin